MIILGQPSCKTEAKFSNYFSNVSHGKYRKKTIQFWHEQYHEQILIFLDDLKVAKGAVTREMFSKNRELFKVQFSQGIS